MTTIMKGSLIFPWPDLLSPPIYISNPALFARATLARATAVLAALARGNIVWVSLARAALA
jgi:hypothetical protein